MRNHLQRTHKAIGWPGDPVAEPRPYDGPEEIPLEDQSRVVAREEGFVACYRGYLDDVQRADNALRGRRQESFLRRATLAEFVELAERTAQVIRALANGEDDTTLEGGSLSNRAFFSLWGLRRAKEVRPDADWPDDALKRRDLLADAAGPLLAAINDCSYAKGALKHDDAVKALGAFTRATARLREIAKPQATPSDEADDGAPAPSPTNDPAIPETTYGSSGTMTAWGRRLYAINGMKNIQKSRLVKAHQGGTA